MSHVLGQFLSSSGRYFDRLISDLERSTGNRGLDANLVGQVVTQANLKIRSLGLTPGDTLPEEMYQALINKFINDSQLVHYQLLGDNLDLDFLNFQIARQLNLMIDRPVFGLSDKAIVKLLQEVPPTKLLKEAKSASLEELLGKYHQAEVLELAWLLGTKAWRTKLIAAAARLPKCGFELRELLFHSIDRGLAKLYRPLLDGEHFHVSGLTGSVLFLNYSLPDSRRQMVLGSLVQGSGAAQRLLDFSNQLQFLAKSGQLIDSMEDLFIDRVGQVWYLCDTPVPWRSVYRALANSTSRLAKQLKSELAGCKLGCIDTVTVLNEHFDNLEYWLDGQTVAFKVQNDIVSVNLADVAVNAHTPRQVWLGQTTHFESALWDKLVADYLEHDYLIRQIKMQLKANQKEKK